MLFERDPVDASADGQPPSADRAVRHRSRRQTAISSSRSATTSSSSPVPARGARPTRQRRPLRHEPGARRQLRAAERSAGGHGCASARARTVDRRADGSRRPVRRGRESPRSLADPQVAARADDRSGRACLSGHGEMLGVPLKLSDTPGSVRTAPPALGQHTDTVLRNSDSARRTSPRSGAITSFERITWKFHRSGNV